MHKKGMYEKYFKRLFDFSVSLIALIVLSPLLLITIILIKVKLGNPFIFKQQRPGLDNKIFTIYKFRTMLDKKDSYGKMLPDSERVTKLGKFLRSTSIDELPSLVNIIKGDMSIVGPRPQLVKDMVFMSEKQKERHFVRPGLTGLAQVSGRNNLTWEEKFTYDLEYIKNISFFRDLKIILLTLIKVLKKEDISTNGMETAEDLGDYLLRLGIVTQDDYKAKEQISKELLSKN